MDIIRKRRRRPRPMMNRSSLGTRVNVDDTVEHQVVSHMRSHGEDGVHETFQVPEQRKAVMEQQDEVQENEYVVQLGQKVRANDIPMFYRSEYQPPEQISVGSDLDQKEGIGSQTEPVEIEQPVIEQVEQSESLVGEGSISTWRRIVDGSRFSLSFAVSGLVILFIFGTISFVSSGLQLKGKVLGVSKDAYSSIEDAVVNIKDQDFEASSVSFREANSYFEQAAYDFEQWGGLLVRADFTVPFLSQITTGKNALEAGKHLTSAGEKMNGVVSQIALLENPFGKDVETSVLDIYKNVIRDLGAVDEDLLLAQEAIEKVKISDLPEDKRQEFILLKETLPALRENMQSFMGNSDAFIDVFGGNGPRKFLFLFQNNQELRATGGFIGSYGLLDIHNGNIRKFFIDGIFNPDGQLSVDVVPPEPIQKISAGWSLHDSNWFADFPLSAEKAIYFYEKTGGPTVDGVITITPTVMQRLLEMTGPIYLEKYDVTIDTENFIESIQQKVEVDYDKEENKPKQILADLAPILLEKVFQFDDYGKMLQTLDILYSGIQEKHILLYSRNDDMQKLYEDLGWSGEVRETPNDYLSVVHTNINGYKTDGVVDETIEHSTIIKDDGRIVDTVKITREHQGGDTEYEWWNKVNSDFMRVYVPKGSKLLSAEGHTRERNDDPLDYEALNFHRDNDVVEQESTLVMDSRTGTYIFEESDKTVFGNWIYVSPKETATVEYTYELPFTIDVQKVYDSADAYSLLVQKQSGTIGPSLTTSVMLPREWAVEWKYPENMVQQENEIRFEGDLEQDVFSALVLRKE